MSKYIVYYLLFFLPLTLQAQKLKKARIDMQKTGCFGTCPAYSVTVKSNGWVYLNAERYLSRTGKFKKKMTKEETVTLFTAFSESKFFEFSDDYDGKMTDFPTTYVTYKIGKRSKKIRDYYGSPDELKDLENRVHLIVVQEEGWIPVKE
jgi:hypothetical protein